MKAITFVPILLGLLSSPAKATGAAKHQVVIVEGGYRFKLSTFIDGRTLPFRVYFWDKELTGSSYRIGHDGHVEYFKAGDEVYFDRQTEENGSLTFEMTMESDVHEDSEKDGRVLSDEEPSARLCADNKAYLDAVCASALPTFCEKVDRYLLGEDGRSSVAILCENGQDVCVAAYEMHVSLCEDVEDQGPMCDNGLSGIQNNNGACCAAGCGMCGGVGCSKFGIDVGLDAHDCCATEIVNEGDPCSSTGQAPCYIDGV